MSPTERDSIQAPSTTSPEPTLNAVSDMERFKLEDFTLLKVIGKGSFGKVMFASFLVDLYLKAFQIKETKSLSLPVMLME